MLLAVTGSALAAQPTLRGGIPGRMPRFETDQLSADDVGALVDGQVRLSQTGSADMKLRTHFLGEGPGPGRTRWTGRAQRTDALKG